MINGLFNYVRQMRMEAEEFRTLKERARYVRPNEDYTQYKDRLWDLDHSPDALSHCVSAKMPSGLFKPLSERVWLQVKFGIPLGMITLGDEDKVRPQVKSNGFVNLPSAV